MDDARLALETTALDEIRLLTEGVESEPVLSALLDEAMRIGIRLLPIANDDTLALAAAHLGSVVRGHVRQVWGPDGPEVVADILDAVAECARRHSDYDGPHVVWPADQLSRTKVTIKFPTVRPEPAATEELMARREAARGAAREYHRLLLLTAAGGFDAGYRNRWRNRTRKADPAHIEYQEHRSRQWLEGLRGSVGGAPQISLVRSAVREFADDPQFVYVVLSGLGTRFVQFARGGPRLLGETVGDAYLPAEQPLGLSVESNLRTLGWSRPRPSDDVQNWWMEWAAGWDVREVGALAVATLLALKVLRDPVKATLGNGEVEVVRTGRLT